MVTDASLYGRGIGSLHRYQHQSGAATAGGMTSGHVMGNNENLDDQWSGWPDQDTEPGQRTLGMRLLMK